MAQTKEFQMLKGVSKFLATGLVLGLLVTGVVFMISWFQHHDVQVHVNINKTSTGARE